MSIYKDFYEEYYNKVIYTRDEVMHLIHFLIDKGCLKFVDSIKNIDDLIDEFENLDGRI